MYPSLPPSLYLYACMFIYMRAQVEKVHADVGCTYGRSRSNKGADECAAAVAGS